MSNRQYSNDYQELSINRIFRPIGSVWNSISLNYEKRKVANQE